LVGWLFGNTSTTKTKDELIVLITPHVVQSVEDATAITNEFKEQLRDLKRELRQPGQIQ